MSDDNWDLRRKLWEEAHGTPHPFSLGAVLGTFEGFKERYNVSEVKTYINPPDECDACQASFIRREGEPMFDARTTTGQWGNLCRVCFDSMHCSLGTGRGQEYAFSVEHNAWVKVAG